MGSDICTGSGAGNYGEWLVIDRYALQFYRETEAEIRERKEAARRAIVSVPESGLEIEVEKYFLKELDFPKRPPWNYDMSREELEARENRYFTDMILVLNKIDLAPAPLVVAWKNYFQEKYPALHILTFTSYPSYNLRGSHENKAGLQIRRRRGKLRMAAEGAKTLMEACKDIVKDEVDLSSWSKKISEEMEIEFEDEDDDSLEVGETVELKKVDTSYIEHEKYKDGILTIGCIGQPNVGKSSLMNAIMGKKIVSVSKTPGHTKHFQTIYLTPNIRLCDCPGLVFPSNVPKTLQVLMGSFPIAQLKEPYSSIQYLAERINLPRLLVLQHPENDEEWSAMDICDEFWACHADVQTVCWIQGKANDDVQGDLEEHVYISSDEEEDEGKNKVLDAGDDKVADNDEKDASSESEDSEDNVVLGTANKFAALVGD
ncbi:Guanine nucleotide-binding protein-like 1 [Blattella germanica]|nr:Guanine nucleotide-binding protein-like 1 [Blattella germanica]